MWWIFSAGVLLVVALMSTAVFWVLIRRRKTGEQRQLQPGAPGSYEEKKYRQAEAERWLANQPTLERVEIRSEDGLRLAGHLLPAEGGGKKILLASHGYRCSGLREWGLYADFWHRQGYQLMMPDHRAHGDSEGRYIGFGWLDRRDLLRWCDYLCGRFGEDCEILLHGISMGSAAVLLTGSEKTLPKQVKGIIADCGFTNAWEEACYRFRADYHLPPFPFLYGADLLCRLRGRVFKVAGKYLRSYALILLITFGELSLGLVLLGVDNAVLIAFCIALFDILPVAGTGGIMIPWAIFSLIGGDWGFAVGLVVIWAVITIVRNIIEPKIVGRQVGLHPLLALIAMFVGTKLFGLVGLFLLPLTLAIVLPLLRERFGSEREEEADGIDNIKAGIGAK